MRHIVFEYQYRDGCNYKRANAAIFENDSQLSLQKLDAEICKHLIDGEFFIADQVDVPEVFLWNPDVEYDLDDETTYPEGMGPGMFMVDKERDHCFHEFLGLSNGGTDAKPTDDRTITEFIQDIKQANQEGWNVFEPMERRKQHA